jgi:hypothetical protein
VDDTLLRRLRTEQARALLSDADPRQAVMLACDLLVAGITSEAVVTLATESPRTLPPYDAARQLSAVAAELGLAEPDLPTAVELIAAETAERILDRSISAEEGTYALYVVGHEGSPLSDLLPQVTDRAADHRLDALARTILDRVRRSPAGPDPSGG